MECDVGDIRFVRVIRLPPLHHRIIHINPHLKTGRTGNIDNLCGFQKLCTARHRIVVHNTHGPQSGFRRFHRDHRRRIRTERIDGMNMVVHFFRQRHALLATFLSQFANRREAGFNRGGV